MSAAMLQAEPTWLLIADISGYTAYLASVELDHAQDILAEAELADRRKEPSVEPDLPAPKPKGALAALAPGTAAGSRSTL